ncbi:hypothetical protein RJ55_08697 [Drechmeria coniospora]|nr:hypothetical protein RJ55_08697 [Drechmeria coniospora]
MFGPDRSRPFDSTGPVGVRQVQPAFPLRAEPHTQDQYGAQIDVLASLNSFDYGGVTSSSSAAPNGADHGPDDGAQISSVEACVGLPAEMPSRPANSTRPMEQWERLQHQRWQDLCVYSSQWVHGVLTIGNRDTRLENMNRTLQIMQLQVRFLVERLIENGEFAVAETVAEATS